MSLRQTKRLKLFQNGPSNPTCFNPSVPLFLKIKSYYEISGLEHAHFRTIVAGRLSKEGHSGAELNSLVDTLCEAVKDRLVFLAALTEKRIGFEIRSLQEFMAGDYLMDAPDASPEKHDEAVRDSLSTIATAPHWRNVFLFAAGRIYAREQRFRDSLEALCHQVNESDEDAATSANFGGSRLALDLLEDGSARNQPKSSKLLMRVAARLLDLPPCEVHPRLLHQVNSNTVSIFREELERRLTSTKDSLWASAWSCLDRLCRSETPWASELVARFISDEPHRLATALGATRPTDRETPLTRELAARASRIPMSDWLKWHSSGGRTVTLTPKVPVACPFATVAAAALEGLRWRRRRAPDIRGKTSMITANLAPNPSLSFTFFGMGGSLAKLPTHEGANHWHFSWKVWLAGLRFAKHPDASTLALELEWLFHNWEASGQARQLGIGPWPIAACLDWCKSPGDLKSLIEKARTGALGDTGDWRAAEQRWRNLGVTVEDLLHVSVSASPFGPDIRKKGVPFQIAQLRSAGDLNLRFFEQLLERYPEVNDTFHKEKLGSLLTILQFFLWARGDKDRDVDRSMAILLRTARLAIKIDPQWALHATSRASFSAADLDFYDELGRADFSPHSVALREAEWGKSVVDGFTAGLSKAVVQAPQRVGLLRLLAFCQPGWASKSKVPLELLDETNLQSDPLRCAGLVIRLDQIAWTTDEAAHLAKATAAALEERPDIVERTCGVIEKTTGTSAEREAFLVALLREIPDRDWRLRGRVVEALNVLLARRSAVSI
ncbi:MAG: hypothetical protein KGJ88_09505 [Verrucomicrobiota bacterium]|nr:hypothetical protein [Verrucomicrobiota bacterium]